MHASFVRARKCMPQAEGCCAAQHLEREQPQAQRQLGARAQQLQRQVDKVVIGCCVQQASGWVESAV